jgi:microcin C transport system ATP-binding protein
MSTPVVTIRNLSVSFRGQRRKAVDSLDLDIMPGERLAIVGESGSGKSVTALSLLGLLEGASVDGEVIFDRRNLLALPEAELQKIRGKDIAMIFQEPMTALNPLRSIGDQIMESLLLHTELSKPDARVKAFELLAKTGIRDPDKQVSRYPHQLSGGQRQRAMIAMALACRPRLLIADEPTTALDASIRAKIIKLLLNLQREYGMAILLITHDLHLVRRFAERVAVMKRGRVVESGETEAVFEQATHPYAIKLINSQPRGLAEAMDENAPIVLETRDLTVRYAKPSPGIRGWFKSEYTSAIRDVSISLRRGETVGIVGESGSGKSTLAQAVLRLIPSHSGSIEFDAERNQGGGRAGRLAFRKHVQVVFQDPFGSLSPRLTVAQIIGEGIALHFPDLSTRDRQARISAALTDVALPSSILQRYPHEFSGGQRQRIAIARALALRPEILVLDEPTSALDVSIQKQVLELLAGLQRKYSLSYLLISHDLAVVRALSHRIYVMKEGSVVEHGPTHSILSAPEHQYTQQLIEAAL